jgi:hypothetical protein
MYLPLLGRPPVPHDGLTNIFRHAAAVLIEVPEIPLSFRIPLLRVDSIAFPRLGEPLQGLRLVFGNAVAEAVRSSEKLLPFRVPLFGRLAVPPHRFGRVLRKAL